MATTPIPREFSEFLNLIVATGVRHLVVGGHAVALHGHPRMTGDLDVWVADDADNLERLRDALIRFGFGAASIPPGVFRPGKNIVRFGVEPLRIEIASQISGVKFDACHARAVIQDVEGVKVHFISRSDLLANKRSSARPKDLADVSELERSPKRRRSVRTRRRDR